MLSKRNRLTKTKDFKEVYKKGSSRFLPSLTLRYKRRKIEDDPKSNNSRFGIVISGKVLRTNIERNRLKRQLRSILCKKIKLKQIKPGFDCIISVRKKIKRDNYQQVEKDLEKLIRKTRIYNE